MIASSSSADLAVACHEAAHAATALAVGGNVGLLALSYDSYGVLHGEFRENFDANWTPPPTIDAETEVFERLCGSGRTRISGESAMRILTVLGAGLAFDLGNQRPDAFTCAETDLERAKIMARAAATNEDGARRLWARALVQAASHVDRHRAPIITLGKVLADRRRMVGDDISRVLHEAGFPVPVLGRSDISDWPATIATLAWCGRHL
jgi:hypothetical protein